MKSCINVPLKCICFDNINGEAFILVFTLINSLPSTEILYLFLLSQLHEICSVLPYREYGPVIHKIFSLICWLYSWKEESASRGGEGFSRVKSSWEEGEEMPKKLKIF